jgi:hypothetical protein
MQSPFPGMDPYLEQHWGDVHHNLISLAQGMLNDHLYPAIYGPGRRNAFWSIFPETIAVIRMSK